MPLEDRIRECMDEIHRQRKLLDGYISENIDCSDEEFMKELSKARGLMDDVYIYLKGALLLLVVGGKNV